MSENIIELQGVNKWFGDFQVLKNVDLTVGLKQKIVVCGPSGSGKSTLIRCINRLEEHQKGSIVVLNLGKNVNVNLNRSSIAGLAGKTTDEDTLSEGVNT